MSLKSCAEPCAKSQKAGGAPVRAGSGSGSRMRRKENTSRANTSVLAGSEVRFRFLAPNELGSVIFGCTNATMNECLSKKLFGLPSSHMVYVQNIRKDMPLFLFNYTDRKLHGIYEALSDGKRDIDTTAWASPGTGQTMYPAQVSAHINWQCDPLRENDFKHVIRDNYYGQSNHFKFELDHQQTHNLIMLFRGQLDPPHKDKFHIPEVSNPLSPTRSSMVLGQGESWQIDSQMHSLYRDQRFQDDSGSRRLSYDESEQEVESYFPSEIDNAGTESYGVDLCISYSEPPSFKGSALSRPSSSLCLEENVPEEKSSAILQERNGSSKGERSFVKVDLQGPNEISTGSLEDVTEDVNLNFCKKEGSHIPVSGLYNDNNRCQIPGSPPEDNIQKSNNSNQGSDVTTSGIENSEQETDQLGHVLLSKNTGSCLLHEREIQHFSASLFQIRQEGVELKEMVKAARIEQHCELQSANTLLQFLKMKIDSEISSLRTEVDELREQVRNFFSEKHEKNVKDFETSCIPVSGSAPMHKSGSTVYVIGGLSGHQWLETVDVFCPPVNKLEPAFPMHTPRPFPAAIALDKCLYVLGGGQRSSWFDIVEMYDETKDQWALCSPMNLRRGFFAGVTISHGIIALGGENEQGPLSDVEWYDACTGKWTVSAKMLEKRSFPVAVELDGAVYSLGGFDGSQYLRTVERLDPRQGSWTSISSMISPRAGLSAASFNGKIYALGGFDGQSFLNTVEVFDQRANKWEEAVPMNLQRAHGAAVVVHNILYLIGGLSDKNKPIEFIDCYQEGIGWHALGPASIGKRCYMSAVVL